MLSDSCRHSMRCRSCFRPEALRRAISGRTAARVLHLESGAWTNRTISGDFATQTICARVPSLSPFAIVDSNIAPTAANVTVGGRVLIADGRGIPNAQVSIEDKSGNVRTALTSSFGYYRFETVEVGQAYVISVAAKRYAFDNPVRTITVIEELTDVDFVATSGAGFRALDPSSSLSRLPASRR
jgi:hypothetical protein